MDRSVTAFSLSYTFTKGHYDTKKKKAFLEEGLYDDPVLPVDDR